MLFDLTSFFSVALSLPFCWSALNEKKLLDNGPGQKQIISMDPTNLDLLFFRSAVFALFKVKADTILSSLPQTERIVYRQCESDSNGTLNILAKCLVSLFKIRDFRTNSNVIMHGHSFEFKNAELPWISAVSKKLFETEMKKVKEEGQNVKLGNAKLAKDNSNKLKKNLLKLGEVLGREGRRTPPHRRDRKVLRDIVKPRGKRGKDPDLRHAELKEHELKQYPHVQKLFRVERFYRLLQRCDEFIRRKDEDHSKLLQRSGVPFQLHTKAVEQSPFLGVAETQLLKNMNVSNDKLSILSPKLLSLIPQNGLSTTLRLNLTCLNTTEFLSSVLLSPTLLSFHEQGDLSLPSLLKLGLSNGNETLAWLDLLLQISGASSTLDKLISSIEPAFEEVQQRIYPAVLRLEELEERFRRLRNVESGKQRQEMDSRGYTFLSKEQSRIVLGQAEDADGGGLDEEDLEEVLEKDIRSIAQMSEHEMDSVELESRRSSKRKREKRFLRTEPFGQVRLLNPYLFANQLHDGAVLRRVALSPRAFSSSIMSPEFGQVEVLSPRAFLATILSPRAAIANILSPSALTFRLLSPQAFLAEVLNPKAFVARILSPRAMSAYVLSPRAFMFTILSPKALELRVLSPTTLSFTVLSPTIGGAKIASPQSFSMAVLSPSILSPSFLNKGGVSNVKILSPSILSGGGGEAEK